MNPWILAARPRTLGAAFIPVLTGAVLAFASGNFCTIISILTLASALLIQIATNFFNDAIDHAKGADTPERLGPTRVTLAGLLPYRRVMIAAFLCLLFAVAAAIPLVLHGGFPILAIGLASLLCAWLYTGGPYPLAYLGLGEIFVIIFFGVFAVVGTFYLNTLAISVASLLAGLQIGLLSTVILTINNLRDLETDRTANKHTLAARFGLTFARRENATLIFLPFVLGIAWIPLGFLWAFLFPLVTLPLAWWLARSCLTATPDRAVNQLLAQAARLHAIFGLFLASGILLP